MQSAARQVKHSVLCPIGPAANNPEVYDYARASGSFFYGNHDPLATVPFIVETWVSATSRKGRSIEIEQVFGNRTAIVGDEVDAQRNIYGDEKYLYLRGCGLDGAIFSAWPLGDFRTILHIVSPFIPLLSTGKRPNLRPFRTAIETAVRRAFIKSRHRLPPEKTEPKAPPPPKPTAAAQVGTSAEAAAGSV
jgi:hypothetical protein